MIYQILNLMQSVFCPVKPNGLSSSVFAPIWDVFPLAKRPEMLKGITMVGSVLAMVPITILPAEFAKGQPHIIWLFLRTNSYLKTLLRSDKAYNR